MYGKTSWLGGDEGLRVFEKGKIPKLRGYHFGGSHNKDHNV